MLYTEVIHNISMHINLLYYMYKSHTRIMCAHVCVCVCVCMCVCACVCVFETLKEVSLCIQTLVCVIVSEHICAKKTSLQLHK